ncbi:hypothetical protein QQF40_15170 [Cobetia sp. LC6]|uniref:hypothetical protein n=1 Tax=Cobetia sp. LC6 TaxID=3050947 RepID=UPI0025579387|nr:hypothetical protein [Cobetia sp. LC6]MDL2192724.1 hypothetical protein [Cobetia sp. LC6]
MSGDWVFFIAPHKEAPVTRLLTRPNPDLHLKFMKTHHMQELWRRWEERRLDRVKGRQRQQSLHLVYWLERHAKRQPANDVPPEAGSITLALNHTHAEAMVKELIRWRSEHHRRPIGRREAYVVIGRFLEEVNQSPGVLAMLPQWPTLARRKSVLPMDAKALANTTRVLPIIRELRHSGTAFPLLHAAVELGVRAGLGQQVILVTLGCLTRRHFERDRNIPNEWVWIPAHSTPPRIMSSHLTAYRLPLESTLATALKTLRAKKPASSKDEWLLAEKQEDEHLSITERIRIIKERMRQELASLVKILPLTIEERRTIKLTTLLSALPHAAVLGGLPGCWVSQFSRYPIPYSSAHGLYEPHSYFARLEAPPASTVMEAYSDNHQHGPVANDDTMSAMDLFATRASETNALSHSTVLTQPPGQRLITQATWPIDWLPSARRIIKQWIGVISSDHLRKTSDERVKKRLESLLLETSRRLTRLMGIRHSYPAMVLYWLHDLRVTRMLRVSSLHTYLSRSLPMAMADYALSIDINEWDNDSAQEMCWCVPHDMGWSVSTTQSFLGNMGQLIRFMHSMGVLLDVEPPVSGNSKTPSAKRIHFATLRQMEKVRDHLLAKPDETPDATMQWLSIALGFHGGMRASEVCALTLRDIRIECPQGTFSLEHWLEDQFPAGHSPALSDTEFSPPPLHETDIIHEALSEQLRSLPEVECRVYIRGGKTPAARRVLPLHLLTFFGDIQLLAAWWVYRRRGFPTTALSDIALFGPSDSCLAFNHAGLIAPAIDAMRDALGNAIDFHSLRHAAVSWWLIRLEAAQSRDILDDLQEHGSWGLQKAPLKRFLEGVQGYAGEDSQDRGMLLYQLAIWIGHRTPEQTLTHYAHSLEYLHRQAMRRASEYTQAITPWVAPTQ